MPERFMSQGAAIRRHLSYNPTPVEGVRFFSGFAAVLRDARGASGRDLDTGAVVGPAHTASWLGALGYLVLLDQIGHCFRPSDAAIVRHGSSVEAALGYFTDVPSAHRSAIYALRNALAHDFSLVNANRNNPELCHHFALSANPVDPLVELPQVRWDGDPFHRRADNRTTVNLWRLGDTAEIACRRLFELANRDLVDVVLEGGSDELVQRYSIMYRVQEG